MTPPIPSYEVVDLELARAVVLRAECVALFAAFDPVPGPPNRRPLCETAAVHPLSSTGTGSSFLSNAEPSDMIEEICPFVPTRPCGCERHARMYSARGNNQVSFFVECSACGLRTARMRTMTAAADEWNAGAAAPINYSAPAQAVAA